MTSHIPAIHSERCWLGSGRPVVRIEPLSSLRMHAHAPAEGSRLTLDSLMPLDASRKAVDEAMALEGWIVSLAMSLYGDRLRAAEMVRCSAEFEARRSSGPAADRRVTRTRSGSVGERCFGLSAEGRGVVIERDDTRIPASKTMAVRRDGTLSQSVRKREVA